MGKFKEKLTKKCLICDAEFQVLPSRAHVKCCSSECRSKARAEATSEWFKTNKRVPAEKVKLFCADCGKEFYKRKKLLESGMGRGQFCSKACKDKAHENYIIRTCTHCGKEFKAYQYAIDHGNALYCSRACRNSATHSLDKHYKWKGGIKILKGGYIGLMMKDHPFADPQGYYEEHRYVMEQHLGRHLKPEEIVHHINFIKTDNRIENLMLFPSNSAHRQYHSMLDAQTAGGTRASE